MSKPKVTVVCAAVIRGEKEILLVKPEGNVWILPGGKMEPGESDLEECLSREANKVGVSLRDVLYYWTFPELTPYTCGPGWVRVYFARSVGKVEISRGKWIWTSHPGKYSLSDITRKVVDSLTKDGYL